MACLAPANEMFPHNENKYFSTVNERFNGWPATRKHCIEDFSSDEEAHPAMQEKQSLDRLKEIHDLSMRATLLNAEAFRYSDESMTPNNRKRLFSEYNSSPEYRSNDFHPEDGRYKLTLSQFATSASEQEPLYAEDEDVEEILMRLRHGHDYYSPKGTSNDDFTIGSVTITPDPPVKGQNITVALKGTMNKQVQSGNVHVDFKYSIVTILDKTEPLCTAPVTCPIAAGPFGMSVTEMIPSDAPSGSYSGTANITDQSGNEIACAKIALKL